MSSAVLMEFRKPIRERLAEVIIRFAEKLVEFYNRDFFWAEASSGFALLLFAFLDFVSNSPITLIPRYAILLQVMPKHAWDALAIFVGLQQWWALYTDNVVGRFTASIVACYLVAIVCLSTSFSIEGGPPPGVSWPATFILINLVSVVRGATRIRDRIKASR